jgi:hypothetical protein
MSYCRFSSNNFWCDVYVYEDVNGGWTTHVASNRHVIPPIPVIPHSWWIIGRYDNETKRMVYPNRLVQFVAWVLLRVYMVSYRLHSWSVRVIPRRKIGLPHDGARYNDDTPEGCALRLSVLREVGYKVPQYAIDALLDEAFSQ